MASQMKDAPSKFKDIISKSTLIQNGPPARYQLKPKKEILDGESEEKSRLRRWTFGKKNHSKDNKTILLVGETGTGKSTMINALVNHVMGVTTDDKVWFEIVEDVKRSQSESQTSGVTVYEIFGFEGVRVPFSLTIIDTPGYGDTRGDEKDEVVANKLIDLFRTEKGISGLDAVGFVLKAGMNRLSGRQKYIFNSVVDLFGKDMEKNIVILMTHSDGAPAPNVIRALEDANIKCAREKNQPVNFLFNNRQTEIVTEDNQDTIKFALKINKNGVQQFFKFIEEKAAPQKIKYSLEVFKERERLKACIGCLKERIELLEKKLNIVRETKQAFDQNKVDIQRSQNFTYEENETYKEKVNIDRWWDNKAVTCTICEENCHYPGCTIALNPLWCEVMINDGDEVKCTSCQGKCSHTVHVKDNFKYVTKTRRVTKTYEKMKKFYEIKEKLANLQESVQSELEAEKQKLEVEKISLLEEAYDCVVSLEAIALSTHSTHYHLDFLMEKLAEIGDQEKVNKLDEIKKRREYEQNTTNTTSSS